MSDDHRALRAFLLFLAAVLALVVGLAVAVSPVRAAAQCGAREAVVAELADRWGEARVSLGLAANGAVVETFVNPDTGTWTLIATGPSGTACLLASGEAFTWADDPAGEPL